MLKKTWSLSHSSIPLSERVTFAMSDPSLVTFCKGWASPFPFAALSFFFLEAPASYAGLTADEFEQVVNTIRGEPPSTRQMIQSSPLQACMEFYTSLDGAVWGQPWWKGLWTHAVSLRLEALWPDDGAWQAPFVRVG